MFKSNLRTALLGSSASCHMFQSECRGFGSRLQLGEWINHGIVGEVQETCYRLSTAQIVTQVGIHIDSELHSLSLR